MANSNDLPTPRTPRGGWDAHRRRATIAVLVGPAAFIALFFVTPLARLAWLSVAGDEGGLTFAGYAELIAPAYGRLALFTIQLSLVVTGLCLLLGYPIAYFLAHHEDRATRWLMLALLIALWISVLSRTYGWIILLQRNGIINNLLVASGLVDRPLALVYNRLGVYIGMIHILLPFMVISILPMLKSIDPALTRAAASLGATPWRVFRRIYFPLSLPGVLAGSTLVFAMALGFFITPAILGGGRASTIVMAIRNQVQVLVDLRLAAATSMVLLVASLATLAIYERLAGIDRLFGRTSR